jgi:hypothetical protein
MLEAISEVRSLIETIGQSVLDEAEEVTAQTVEDAVRKRYEPLQALSQAPRTILVKAASDA